MCRAEGTHFIISFFFHRIKIRRYKIFQAYGFVNRKYKGVALNPFVTTDFSLLKI